MEQTFCFGISLPIAEVRPRLVVSTVTLRGPPEGGGGSTCSPGIILFCSEGFSSLIHDNHCTDSQELGQSCLPCSFMHHSICSQVCFDVLCSPFFIDKIKQLAWIKRKVYFKKAMSSLKVLLKHCF